MIRPDATTFLAHTLPGLERIAWREVQRHDRNAELLGFRTYRAQNGLLLFRSTVEPAVLLGLRTVEDVFHLFADVADLPTDRTGPRALGQVVQRARALDAGVGAWRAAGVRRGRGRLTVWVVARQQGHALRYRRDELQRAVEQALAARPSSRWQVIGDAAQAEVWVTVLEQEAFAALRLSDRTMRHRPYQQVHLPGSLRPSVAAALAFLTDPAPDDVFGDPLCGAATIVIERAHLGRYRLLLGGDIDPAALAAARANVGRRYQPLGLIRWDARALPLADGQLDALATNLPFGRQHGTHIANVAL